MIMKAPGLKVMSFCSVTQVFLPHGHTNLTVMIVSYLGHFLVHHTNSKNEPQNEYLK